MNSDIPTWVMIAMFAGFIVFFSTMPETINESHQVVVLREVPWAWLLVPCALQLFLGSLGLRVYEWSEFGDDERDLFLRRIALLAAVLLCAWYGGMLLAALFAWTYDSAILIGLVSPLPLVLFWRFTKPRVQLWD